MIPVALSTGSVYTYGTARAFELAERAGYDGVEVLIDERWDTRQPDYLRRLAEQHGLPVLSVHSPFVRLSDWPRSEVERVKRALAVAEAVGARTLNLHVPRQFSELQLSGWKWRASFPFLPPDADQRAFGRWLLDGGLAGLQAQTTVTIAVENLPARRFLGRRFSPYALNTWEELSLLPRLCLDTTHCGTWGADPTEILERLGGRVVHVHLSNYDGRYQHQQVDRGVLRLDRFLDALAGRDYPGVVVVELTPGGLPAQNEGDLVKALRRNLAFCRRHLGQVASGAGSAAPVEAPSPATGAVTGAPAAPATAVGA